MRKGKLYLIPTVIAEETQAVVIPPHILQALPGIQYFLAEDIRTARRYLSSLKVYESIEPLIFEVLNKNTKADQLKKFFEPVFQGNDLGILSESGCPGVADPGSLAVKFAHEHDIQVVPLVGPSSILLALMASGMNGQRFAFHGYLPIDGKDASAIVKTLEKESRSKNQTQIFIETPYRNNTLMAVLMKSLADDTQLCIAVDVTGKDESIRSYSVKKWKSIPVTFPKSPAIFLFLSH
ncbi:MAG TPA: SAM-dependent methyltransferase [Ohtaekwangia sp.]|uniref:SAM-dependent methyltransferase n=1 Tax=Ohtaekwangia sp. TaxID=2066019 RepID=UPI002F95617A